MMQKRSAISALRVFIEWIYSQTYRYILSVYSLSSFTIGNFLGSLHTRWHPIAFIIQNFTDGADIIKHGHGTLSYFICDLPH